MRLSRAIKLVTLSGIVSTLISIILWSSWVKRPTDYDVLHSDQREVNYVLTDPQNRDTKSFGGVGGGVEVAGNDNNAATSLAYHPIECDINGEQIVGCKKEGDQVYMPFDFVKTYFEVYGDLKELEDGRERLLFHHANSIVHPPRATYRPESLFMAFDHYNVENRDRVKCVTASEGVPITTQWNKEGYHYPIQIAQYGLSHHAKYLVEGVDKQDMLILEDAEDEGVVDWSLPDKASVTRLMPEKGGQDGDQYNHIMEFATADSHLANGISIQASEKNYYCFLVDVKFVSNGSLTVVVDTAKNVQIKIHYVFTSTFISFDGKGNIYYGLGTGRTGEWIRLVRNLKFDLLKGLLVKMKQEKVKHLSLTKIREIRFHGHGWLDNLTLAHSVHMEQFYDAANWLVRHQDEKGGWPIMVQRRVVVGVLELSPGWYSAMGQGQAMSVLVRAYLDSKDRKYLNTAVQALRLFQIDSAQGGVRARFFGKYDWYEEYPTTPSSFVLNGFIYSLLGLYDLKQTARGEDKLLAEKIYNSGMTSLKRMIGLYDSGVGTFYDLRHISAGIEPNRARWDYHTTHINQLLQLMIIDDDDIFKTTVKRWLGYLKGKRSRHN